MKAKLNSSASIAWLCALLFVSVMPLQRVAVQSGAGSAARAAEPKVARIPFEMNGNHIYIQGRVNNSGPLWFILDTGAYNSVINQERAEELGLKLQEGFHATGAGGTVESSRVSGVTFDFGNVAISNLTVSTLPLNYLEDTSGRRMDVILGSELFKKFVVEIDYETKHLNLHDPQTFTYKGSGETLPLAFFDNHPYVRASIELPGREPIEGEFVIDLGSNFAVTLLPSFIKQHDLLKSVGKTVMTRGRGVGGEVQMPIGRINSLQLGRFQLNNPVTVFPSRGTFGRDGKAGNIGSAVMSRFKLIFDYSRARMIFEPNKKFSEPFEYDMSGLALTTKSPQFQGIRVLRVLDDSPAAEAGFKQNDEIVAINNRPAAKLQLMQLREMFRKAGREFQMEIKRGDESLKLKLKTRRLI